MALVNGFHGFFCCGCLFMRKMRNINNAVIYQRAVNIINRYLDIGCITGGIDIFADIFNLIK